MFEAEERHFWFRGSRKVVFSWLDRALREVDDARGGGSTGREDSGQRLRILDVGAGTGGVLAGLQRRGDALGVEFHEEGARFIRSRGLPVVRGGLPELPFRDGAFDAAVSLDVFEHVAQDVAAMAEVRRVLRPGGRLITTVPALRWLWSEHDEALHHHRRYHLPEFRDRLKQAGFAVRRISYYNTWLLPPIAAVRLLGRLKPERKEQASPTSDVGELPGPINEALSAVFASEAHWLRHARLPLGASLIADLQA